MPYHLQQWWQPVRRSRLPAQPAPMLRRPRRTTHEFDDLADLVERTPKQPTPPGGQPAAQARRGAGVEAPAPAGKPATKQSRRARKKEAKARLKASKATEKETAKAAKAPATPATPARPAAPSAATGVPAVAAAQPKRRRWVPWLTGLFLLAVLGGLGYLAWVLFRTPTHEVPAVVGLPQDEALALVDDFEWEITVDQSRSDEYRDPGQVILTSPSAGEDLAEGSPLLVVVSEGPEFRQVPDLSGLTLADAEAEIERLELVAAEPTDGLQRGRAGRHGHLVERRGGAARAATCFPAPRSSWSCPTGPSRGGCRSCAA